MPMTEVPFSHVQRQIVTQRAMNTLDKRPFGTELDVYANSYEWMNHSIAPSVIDSHDFRVVIGGKDCKGNRTRPACSTFSAMSFGALSPTRSARSRGRRRGGFYHDTAKGRSPPITARTAATSAGSSAPATSALRACRRVQRSALVEKATLAQVK